MSYTSTHSVVERKVAEKNSAEISEQYPTGSHTLPGAALRRLRVISWPKGVKDAALELGNYSSRPLHIWRTKVATMD